jgi:hypothetical protein
MPGPPPKPRHQRRRQNKPAGGEWVMLPVEGRTEKPPALPRFRKWSAQTREWWGVIWHSPMATQWHDCDVHVLLELAVLREDFRADPKPSLASEIRQREDAFGLTPKGRQALRWRIAEEQGPATVTPLQPRRRNDPYRPLRVTDD